MADKCRCSWAKLNNPIYLAYHDNEWGRAEHDDKKLFELLVLESFQAGLSWECILNKRAAFKKAFDDFDVVKVSRYSQKKLDELQKNEEIVRNRLKIHSAKNNAAVFIEIQKEFGSFDKYIWSFTDGLVIKEAFDIRTTSPLSDMVSKDLKNRGMKFVGTTIIYSYLQAIGVINGHTRECFCNKDND